MLGGCLGHATVVSGWCEKKRVHFSQLLSHLWPRSARWNGALTARRDCPAAEGAGEIVPLTAHQCRGTRALSL